MYSNDPDQNKRNPYTPTVMTLEEQFIYRIASLETTVKERMASLEYKFDAATKESQERRTETASRMAALETRLSIVEKWQTVVTVRASVIASIIMVFWAVFGEYVRVALGTNV
jgi:hypothetical protein